VPPGEDLIGIGADLDVSTLFEAYSVGVFPMGIGDHGAEPIGWWSPDPRGVLRPRELVVSRSLRKAVAHFEVRVDTEFRSVVEAWQDGVLVGGLYGVAIGGLFAGESMFHHVRDASKVALVGLCGLLRADGDPRRLVDVQWQTPHLATLGVREVPRDEYLASLPTVLSAPLPACWA
jgi:leucyl/phenylalanyl-tRNA--protein transferase